MHPFLILFIGMVVILGAIIVLRLNAFLALIGAAIILHGLLHGHPTAVERAAPGGSGHAQPSR